MSESLFRPATPILEDAKPLLVINNTLLPDDEPDLKVDLSPDEKVFYHVNVYGEQWVLYGTKEKAVLRGGDVDWHAYPLDESNGWWPRLILGVDETLWLIACITTLKMLNLKDSLDLCQKHFPQAQISHKLR